ncbi:hypothetical protein FAM09_18260 [Niastella caeni]|uniref:Uncharacterized protein n=1 Tax=Niastella caeni TaxID=2569763 RepID=A0A4S8HNK3_9BACT|nr:hypothetical protein [Niastella caeni]THU36907.1 hypothetical protein FAM09_18260 [Niastella caeni]
MKKANALFITIVIVYALSMIALLFGCKTPKPVIAQVNDSTVVKYFYRDSIIALPGDTVQIRTTVPCPEAKWQGQAKSGRSSLVASLKNGELSIDCKQDSLLLRISLLEKELERKTNTIVHVPVPREVIRYRTPWWAKITLGISIFFITRFCIKNWRLLIAGAKAIIQFFI